jgi:hypothetical protein
MVSSSRPLASALIVILIACVIGTVGASGDQATPTPTPISVPGKPTLGVSVPQTQNVGPPVELDECQLTYTGGLLIGKVSGFIAKFTNDTTLTADVVEIQVLDASSQIMGTIRDVGTFAPGVEITHRYREGEGTVTFTGLFQRARVTCNIWVVHFTNGTVWRAQSQPTGSYFHDDQSLASPAPAASPISSAPPLTHALPSAASYLVEISGLWL